MMLSSEFLKSDEPGSSLCLNSLSTKALRTIGLVPLEISWFPISRDGSSDRKNVSSFVFPGLFFIA